MLTLICLMLIGLMAMGPTMATPALSEDDPEIILEDEGSYTGKWVTADSLGMEFFLPDGWTGQDGGAAAPGYLAGSADGAVRLSIADAGAYSEDQPLDQWAEGFFEGRPFEMAMANGQEAALLRQEDGWLIAVPCGGSIYSFQFTTASPDALSEAMALRIAGTCADSW